MDWWGNFLVFRLADPIVITDANRFLHIFHYREYNNYGWSIQLNTETPYEDASEYLGSLRFDGDNKEDGRWEDIVIDLQQLITNGERLEEFMVIVDKAWYSEKNSQPSKYYFDEIVLSNSPLPREGIQTNVNKQPSGSQVGTIYSKDNKIYVDVPDALQIIVYDVQGRIIAEKNVKTGNGLSPVSVSHSGFFIVKVICGNGDVVTGRVVIM